VLTIIDPAAILAFRMENLDLYIHSPRYGETYYPDGGALWVSWECNAGRTHEDGLPDLVFRRVLLKNGVEIRSYGPHSFEGRTMDREWFNVSSGLETGSDYEFKVDVSDSETHEVYKSASSGRFTLEVR
jgi:hypothetical protein